MTRRWQFPARRQVTVGAIVTLLLALVTTPPLAVHANQLPNYYLPWVAGKSHTVSQGNQQGDHMGLYAYAFDFAGDGWNVFSARAGTVSWLQDGNGPGGCDQLKYQNLANYVVIRSTEVDGSQHEAQYLHLARGSASIRVGLHQAVSGGVPIGVTDSSGWTCPDPPPAGAHLHFQVQQVCGSSWNCQSVPSSFLDADVLAQDPTDGVPRVNQMLRSGRPSLRTDTATVYGNGTYQTNLARGPNGSNYQWSATTGGGFPTDYSSIAYPGNYFLANSNTEVDPMTDLFLYNPFTGATQVRRPNGSGGWTTITTSQLQPGYQIYPGNYVFGSGLTGLFFYRPSDGWMGVDMADGYGGWTSYTWKQWTANLSIYPGHYANHSLTDILVYIPSTGAENVFIADGSGYFFANSPTGGVFSPTNLNIYTGNYYDGDWRTSLFFYHPSDGWTYMYGGGFNTTDGQGGWINGHYLCPTPPYLCYASGSSVYTGSLMSSDGGLLDRREILTDLFWYYPSTGAWSVSYSYGAGYLASGGTGAGSYVNSTISLIHLNNSGGLNDVLFLATDGTEHVWLSNGTGGFSSQLSAGNLVLPGQTLTGDYDMT